MGLSHLRKTDPEAARAWMHGKLLVAFLVEACLQAGDRYFTGAIPSALKHRSRWRETSLLLHCLQRAIDPDSRSIR